MAKLLKVTLELRVEEDGDSDDVVAVDVWDAEDFADVLTGLGNPDLSGELFAGTMVFAKFTDCRVLSSEWRDADPAP